MLRLPVVGEHTGPSMGARWCAFRLVLLVSERSDKLLKQGLIARVLHAGLVTALLVGMLVVLPQGHPIAYAATYSVLFDNAHAETAGNADWVISTSQPDPLAQNPNPQSETDWTGGISAWGVALQRTGRYSLKTNTGTITYGNGSNPLDLSHFNAFVIPEPNTLFSAAEKTAILNFLNNGGGLFMVADHNGSDRNNDGHDSLNIFNDLMNNGGAGSDVFGIQFDVLNIQTENPSNDTPNPDPILQGPFGNATSSIIRSGTTETINPSHNPNARGVIYRNSVSNTGNTGIFVARSSYGSGRVIAVGDSSAIDDGTCVSGNNCFNGWNDPAGNNNILFPNGTEWLVGGGGGGPTNTPTPASATNTPTRTPTPLPNPTNTPTNTPIASGSIVNGGFESGLSGWTTGGVSTPVASTAQVHSGSGSALLGATGTEQNGDSSLYQTITVPSSGTPTLSFWYWPSTTDSLTYDWQEAQVRNPSGSTLASIFKVCSNARTWTQVTYNLSAYKGQTVQIYFNAHGDGANDPTFMYLDDVTLSSGAGPTNTPTNTPPPAATNTPTNTPLPAATNTPTPTPSSGSQLIQNGGFESGSSSWVESSSGGYEIVDSSNPHSGAASAYLCGYNSCADTIYQTVSIPSNATSATLTYYWYMSTQETSHSYDFMYVRVRNSSGTTLTTLQTVSDGSSANGWQSASYDVSAYKGQTVQIAFVATNDSQYSTNFYVDDVLLNVH